MYAAHLACAGEQPPYEQGGPVEPDGQILLPNCGVMQGRGSLHLPIMQLMEPMSVERDCDEPKLTFFSLVRSQR